MAILASVRGSRTARRRFEPLDRHLVRADYVERMFDQHAAALLAFADLLIMDNDLAEVVTGRVLLEYAAAASSATPTAETRRTLALALLTQCQRLEDSVGTAPGLLLGRQARAAVGLAVFAPPSCRAVDTEMGLPGQRAAVLLRNGLLDGPKQVGND
jgi:hypothetical protein